MFVAIISLICLILALFSVVQELNEIKHELRKYNERIEKDTQNSI